MKKLLKILALWFIKISGINLVEPYTLEHLKNMIHSVNADYSKFKYKPFLVDMKAIDETGKVKLTIPVLLDCENIDDVKKVISNITNSLDLKEFYTRINTEKDIHTIQQAGLVTEEFKEGLARFKALAGYESFNRKVEQAREKVKGTGYVLNVDLLEGTSRIEKRQIPILSAKANYFGLEINVEDIYFN